MGVLFFSIGILSIMNGHIFAGIFILLVFCGSLAGVFFIVIHNKVVFEEEFLKIPLVYNFDRQPFSKDIIAYKGIVSVEYVSAQESDDDCKSRTGKRLPCIRFVSDSGYIYRLKLEYFSYKQALIIIEETRLRAGII